MVRRGARDKTPLFITKNNTPLDAILIFYFERYFEANIPNGCNYALKNIPMAIPCRLRRFLYIHLHI